MESSPTGYDDEQCEVSCRWDQAPPGAAAVAAAAAVVAVEGPWRDDMALRISGRRLLLG